MDRTLFNGPAATFATQDAPYIKYLSAINREETKTLTRDLQAAAALIKQTRSSRTAYKNTIAEFLDIRPSADGTTDEVSKPTALDDGRFAVPDARSVATFLSQLSQCGPNVHTRIICLLNERTSADGQAVDGMLFCHILGTMLDLSPTDVQVLAQMDGSMDQAPKQVRQPHRFPMKPGYISLGETKDGKTLGTAAYLGMRRLGDCSPHVVVVRLQACHYMPEHLRWASVGNLWEPLTYSQYVSGSAISTLTPNPRKLFEHALRHCLRSAPPLQGNELTGSWLSALMYMDGIVRAYNVDNLASWWQDSSRSANAHELREINSHARQTCGDLQTSVNQVAAFTKSFPSVRRSDYHDANHFLERLSREAENLTVEIKDALDTQHQIKNLEVASLAVKESQSAIAITVLAFIFIPINMASSLYGMNVQEINETGHSIWGFVVTALVLLACSGLGWVCWRASSDDRLKALSRSAADWVSSRRYGKRDPSVYEC